MSILACYARAGDGGRLDAAGALVHHLEPGGLPVPDGDTLLDSASRLFDRLYLNFQHERTP